MRGLTISAHGGLEQIEVLDTFDMLIGQPSRTIAWGHSLGGLISAGLIQKYPERFSGALLIETLFSLDGLGLLSYEAIVRRDYPVVLGSLYLFTLIGLVIKLISDLLYVVVDPRVQIRMVLEDDGAPAVGQELLRGG